MKMFPAIVAVPDKASVENPKANEKWSKVMQMEPLTRRFTIIGLTQDRNSYKIIQKIVLKFMNLAKNV